LTLNCIAQSPNSQSSYIGNQAQPDISDSPYSIYMTGNAQTSNNVSFNQF
jgi:hypothetical protein